MQTVPDSYLTKLYTGNWRESTFTVAYLYGKHWFSRTTNKSIHSGDRNVVIGQWTTGKKSCGPMGHGTPYSVTMVGGQHEAMDHDCLVTTTWGSRGGVLVHILLVQNEFPGIAGWLSFFEGLSKHSCWSSPSSNVNFLSSRWQLFDVWQHYCPSGENCSGMA